MGDGLADLTLLNDGAPDPPTLQAACLLASMGFDGGRMNPGSLTGDTGMPLVY